VSDDCGTSQLRSPLWLGKPGDLNWNDLLYFTVWKRLELS